MLYTKALLAVSLLLSVIATAAQGAPFSLRTDTPFPPTYSAELGWADIDADSDLDLYFGDTGELYRNDEGDFVLHASFPPRPGGSVDWGDFDGDGDVDLLTFGNTDPDSVTGPALGVYRNDVTSFVEVPVDGLEARTGIARWVDWDNDGDLDFLVSSRFHFHLLLYRNDGTGFTKETLTVPATSNGFMACADYDLDQDLDLALSGYAKAEEQSITRIYSNDSGQFLDAQAGLLGVSYSDGAWGDVDDDGDEDLAFLGEKGWSQSGLYENQIDSLVAAPVPFRVMGFGNVEFGDLDNDGDLDVLFSGWTFELPSVTETYRNDDGTWTRWDLGFLGVEQAGADFGDYDDDGDLDLAITGRGLYSIRADIYRNDDTVANQIPTAPTDLQASSIGDRILFSWSPGSDAETATAGLGYNLRVGTSPSGNEIMPSHSDPSTGRRFITDRGNVGPNTQWELDLRGYQGQTIYWSVQAIDHGKAGSLFAPEQAWNVPVSASPLRPKTLLHDAVPNPFNPATELRFGLAEDQYTVLSIYDLSGARVRTLVDGVLGAGPHTTIWHGRDDRGRQVSSGVYLYQLVAGAYTETKRMVLLK